MGDRSILKKIARRILRSEIRDWAAERDSLARLAESWSPTDRFQEDDVFIAGYPKSGNTWMQVMVASLMYRLDPRHAPDTLIQELVPDIHYKPFYKRFAEVTCFKTHAHPQPDYRRVLNIVRDGRDVLCSYRSFNQAIGERCGLDELISENVELPWGDWQRHVLSWLENPFDAEILTVRYEDLKSDCGGQLRRIAGFLGLEVPEEQIKRIAEGTRFDQMQAREQQFGWDNKLWPRDKAFVRRGVTGAYRDEMSADQIEAFNRRYGEGLRRLGYAI